MRILHSPKPMSRGNACPKRDALRFWHVLDLLRLLPAGQEQVVHLVQSLAINWALKKCTFNKKRIRVIQHCSQSTIEKRGSQPSCIFQTAPFAPSPLPFASFFLVASVHVPAAFPSGCLSLSCPHVALTPLCASAFAFSCSRPSA